MFKNPLKKYQQGGQVSQEQQEMLAAFVTWLSKRVKAFQGMQPEQIVEALNGMGQTPEGLKQVEELKKQFEAESQESQTGVFKVGGKLHDFICKHAKGGHLADCGCNKVEKAQGGTSGIPINNASALENYFNSNISMPNSNELFTGQQVAALINGMHYNQPLVQAQEDGGKVEMDRGGKRLIDGNYEVIVNAPGDTTRTFYNKYNREVMQTYPDGSVRYTTMSNNGNDDYQVNRWVGKPSLLRRIMFGNKQASPEKVNAWNEEIANQPIDPRNQKQISEVPSSGVLKPGLISGLFKGTQRNTAEEMIAMQDGGIVSPIDRMNDKINSMPNINRRIVITENEPVLQGGRQAANEAFINSLRDSSKWVPLDFSKMKMFHNEYPTDHSPYYFHEPKGNELDNRPNYLNQNKNVESLQLLKNENGGVVKGQEGLEIPAEAPSTGEIRQGIDRRNPIRKKIDTFVDNNPYARKIVNLGKGIKESPLGMLIPDFSNGFAGAVAPAGKISNLGKVLTKEEQLVAPQMLKTYQEGHTALPKSAFEKYAKKVVNEGDDLVEVLDYEIPTYNNTNIEKYKLDFTPNYDQYIQNTDFNNLTKPSIWSKIGDVVEAAPFFGVPITLAAGFYKSEKDKKKKQKEQSENKNK